MQYTLNTPPFYGNWSVLSRNQAKIYYEWYIEHIPKRIEVLQQALRTSKEDSYQEWIATKTKLSLDVLGKWLVDNVTVTPVKEERRQEIIQEREAVIPKKYLSILELPDEELSEQTLSIIIDVGMYLGETFRHHFPQVQWELYTKNKRYIDYQRPILIGFGKMVDCNPERLVDVLARRIKDKTQDNIGLRNLFEAWSKYIPQNE